MLLAYEASGVLTLCRKCMKLTSLMELRTACIYTSRRNMSKVGGTKVGGSTRKTHYDILGVKPDASHKVIREAFVSISKEIHPDINPTDPKNHEKFVALNEAYAILSKPPLRRQYDHGLARYIQQQEMMARNVYGSHTAGESHAPGSGFQDGPYDSEAQQRVYWDETYWYTQERSAESAMHNAEVKLPFLVRWLFKKTSNSAVIWMCFGIASFGLLLQFLNYKFSTHYLKRRDLDETRKNLLALHEARTKARSRGLDAQVVHFEDYFTAKGFTMKAKSKTKTGEK